MTKDVPRVVILLENLPVQRDRRVWRQAKVLSDLGLDVTVICPAGTSEINHGTRSGWGLLAPRMVDGVEIAAFVPAPERSGPIGFVIEYTLAWVQMWRCLRRCDRAQRSNSGRSIGGLQACNPPDLFFTHGWWARRVNAPFVFDQHDLAPELFETRFGRRRGWRSLAHWALIVSERLTYRTSDRVIATNESYKRIAVQRGAKTPSDVTVVRNGPDPDTMRRRPVSTINVPDSRYLAIWMGNMGPQDGVDETVRAIAHLVHRLGRRDLHTVFVGTGEVLDDCRALATDLDLDPHVTFTGWIPDDEAFQWLSAADIGLSSDPPGPLNDHSTMNKTLEYMSFGMPVAAHDLTETRFSAGQAGHYAKTGDHQGLARAIDELLADPEAMRQKGRIGRDRIERELSWPHQAKKYAELWCDLLDWSNSQEASDDHDAQHTARQQATG